jgi:hypothetical protein
MSDRAAREFGEAMAVPLYALSQQFGGAQDLCFATAAFARKKERWPNDYTELETFVKGSDGYLTLRKYDRVDFAPQTNGGLEVSFVMQSRTNRVTFSPTNEEQKK